MGFALSSLQDRGWLRQMSKPPGQVPIYKLMTLREEASRETARGLYDLIGALAAGDPSVPGVAELLSVDHPAWATRRLALSQGWATGTG